MQRVFTLKHVFFFYLFYAQIFFMSLQLTESAGYLCPFIFVLVGYFIKPLYREYSIIMANEDHRARECCTSCQKPKP